MLKTIDEENKEWRSEGRMENQTARRRKSLTKK